MRMIEIRSSREILKKKDRKWVKMIMKRRMEVKMWMTAVHSTMKHHNQSQNNSETNQVPKISSLNKSGPSKEKSMRIFSSKKKRSHFMRKTS